MKKVLLSAVLALLVCVASAQAPAKRICGTMDVLQKQLQDDVTLATRMQQIENQTSAYILSHKNEQRVNAVITIPVVFHVLYANASQNISDAQCQAQLNQLNLDFARLNSDAGSTPSAFAGVAVNTNIQFCMAVRDPNGNATTGVIHKSTTTSSFSSNDNVKRSSSGGDDAWPAASYLNIWSCNLGGGLLGYAQFPGGSATTDGVVFLYSSIGSMLVPGTAAPYNLGRTATHEVGHWANLYHIWGDDGSSCSGTDNVGDTPNQSSENYGCPAYPHTDACTGGNGVMFMNYMDYTDDGCMNMFTAGQSTRMNAIFSGSGARVSMLSSLGCTPVTGGSCNVPSGQTTTSITTTTATLNWSAVSGAVSYNVQYRVVGAGSWTSTTSSTTSKALTGLTASTNYEWQVATVCASASSAFSSSATFTTSSTGGGCTDTYESNNTSSTAKTIVTNTDLTGLIGTSTDIDWYKFTTTSPNTKVKITLTNLPYDYDVTLYRSNLQQVGISQNGGTTSEQIISNTTTARSYLVKVIGYGGVYSATSCYTLRASVSSSNFRGMEEITLEPVTAMNEMTVYPNPSSGEVNITFNSASVSSASIRIMDLVGKVVTNRDVVTEVGLNKFNFDMSAVNKGIYFVEFADGTEKIVKKLIVQ